MHCNVLHFGQIFGILDIDKSVWLTFTYDSASGACVIHRLYL